jgi:tetratricopeptide (TPR) repeat protein
VRGERAIAHRLIAEALDNARPVAGLQLRNLEINVLNNLSVLHEAAGDWPAALATWREIAYIATLPLAPVAKSYHYREGWLLMGAGEHAAAASSYERAYAAAEAVGDLFHMDLIARAAGFLAFERGRPDESAAWFRRDADVLREHGDGWNLPSALASLGYVEAASGAAGPAVAALTSALAAAERAGRDDLVVAIGSALAAVRGGGATHARGALRGIRPEPPKPKLTTPFRLADLSSEGAFDDALHTGLAPAGHRSENHYTPEMR